MKDHVKVFDRTDLLQEEAENKEFMAARDEAEGVVDEKFVSPRQSNGEHIVHVAHVSDQTVLLFASGKYTTFEVETDGYEGYSYMSHNPVSVSDGIDLGLVDGHRYHNAKRKIDERKAAQRKVNQKKLESQFMRDMIETHGRENVQQMLDGLKETS